MGSPATRRGPLFAACSARSALDTGGGATRRPRPLDEAWFQWVADNLLRDCSVDSMLASMAAAGLDPEESRTAVEAMQGAPALRAARKVQGLQRKLESVLANQQKLWELAPAYAHVPRRGSLSRDEFVERHVIGSRPVVITDIAHDWPAMARWSPHDFKARFGALELEIQDGRDADPRFEENKLAHRQSIAVGDFVDRVLAGGISNDYYLTANNEVLRRPEFAPLLDDVGSLPEYCVRDALPRSASVWFGPAGTNTPLHHDTLMLLHTQVVGRKCWRLISPLETPRLYNFRGVFSPIDIEKPDLERYPSFRDVKVLEVVLGPGDTLFVPLGWWHQVRSLDIAMSLSYTNLAVPNEFTYANPDIRGW